MHTKLISIIIPTLNEEKLLPSLLKQLTDKSLREKLNYEIIISDGGSSDRTLSIAKKFADKIIEHKGNPKQKISEGKNLGAKVSSGDILVFLCADCRLQNPERFFEYVEKFRKSKYSAATFWFDVFPEEKKISDILFHTFFNYFIWFLNKIIHDGMGRGECQVIKREIFEKVKGFDETLVAGEDYDLYERISEIGKIDVNFNIKVFESPRRYRRYGYIKILWMWFKNSLRVYKILKTQVEEWQEIR